MSVQFHVLSDLSLRGLCASQMEHWLSSIMLWRRRRCLTSAENRTAIVQSSSPKLAWWPVGGALHRAILIGMGKTIVSDAVIWWRYDKRRGDLSVLTTVAEEYWLLGCDVMSCHVVKTDEVFGVICCLHLLVAFSKYGGWRFLRMLFKLLPDYTVTHFRRQYSS